MIPLIGGAFVLGLLAGFIRRGSLANLTSVHIVWTGVLLGSLAIGLIPAFVNLDDAPRQALQLSSHAGVLAFLLANIEVVKGWVRVGFASITAGWFLNLLCIAFNGGMPLSLRAWANAGLTDPPTPGRGGFFKGTIADEDTKLRWLGDVIPVRAIANVISVGDILLLLGIAIVIAGGMTAGRGTQTAPASET